jgi:hypothetical protein
MKVAIMQPYFIPYIGYFQLIQAVDIFVAYDNIEYTKKGWINRNRILAGGNDEFITLPLQKASDFLAVNQRMLADTYKVDQAKILRKVVSAYQKAPYFEETQPLVESILNCSERNLFSFIFYSLQLLTRHLNIQTRMVQSSHIDIDHSLKSEQKVLAICNSLQATNYINPIGGVSLYNKDTFLNHKLSLQFLQSNPLTYVQHQNTFVPWLSIIDVLMFNGKETTKQFLTQYTLL